MKEQSSPNTLEQAVSYAWHDLRGGLNALLLLIEVASRELARRDDLAELGQDLNAARRYTHCVVEQIDRLRALDRFRNGKRVLSSAPVPLKGLWDEVAGHFTRFTREKGVTFAIECPESASGACDREMLSLLLRCLMASSLEQGAARVAMTVAAQGSAHWRVELADDQLVAPARLAAMLDGQINLQARNGRAGALNVYIAWHAAGLMGLTIAGETNAAGTRLHVDVPAATIFPAD